MTKKIALVLLVLLLQLLLACASDLPSVKELNKYYQDQPTATQSTEAYVIGTGDVLAIDVWKEETLSKQVTVRLDGKISLPLLDDIHAAGLKSEELGNLIKDKYKDYVEVPEVSVTVLKSGSGKIYMLGKVGSPGEHALEKQMTILQAIARAGGLGQWADTKDIRLIRKIDGEEKTFKIDYDALVSGKDLSQNILLQPDDVIYVP